MIRKKAKRIISSRPVGVTGLVATLTWFEMSDTYPVACEKSLGPSFPRQNLTNSAANLVNSAARQMKFRGSPRLHS